jgi:hypothetical protein
VTLEVSPDRLIVLPSAPGLQVAARFSRNAGINKSVHYDILVELVVSRNLNQRQRNYFMNRLAAKKTNREGFNGSSRHPDPAPVARI